jgi:hypothetical protein
MLGACWLGGACSGDASTDTETNAYPLEDVPRPDLLAAAMGAVRVSDLLMQGVPLERIVVAALLGV